MKGHSRCHATSDRSGKRRGSQAGGVRGGKKTGKKSYTATVGNLGWGGRGEFQSLRGARRMKKVLRKRGKAQTPAPLMWQRKILRESGYQAQIRGRLWELGGLGGSRTQMRSTLVGRSSGKELFLEKHENVRPIGTASLFTAGARKKG